MPSVVENIALEIKRRLEQITTGNGYSFSVCEVVRPDRLGQLIKPEDALIVLNQGDSTRNAEMDRPGNPPAVGYDVEFEINCFVRPSDRDAVAYEPIQNERGSQIIKAITLEATDPGQWYSFAGNAIIAEVGNLQPFSQSDGNHNGIIVPVRVTYRHDENDPYEVRA